MSATAHNLKDGTRDTYTGIVLLPLDDKVRRIVNGAVAQQLHVAALRVGRLARQAVVDAGPLLDDEHVVAVQVHGVHGASGVVQDQPYRIVAAKVVDDLVLGEAKVGQLGLEQVGVVVVVAEGDAVHLPQPLGVLVGVGVGGVGAVVHEREIEGLRGHVDGIVRGVDDRGRGDGAEGDVAAVVQDVVGDAGRGGRLGGRVGVFKIYGGESVAPLDVHDAAVGGRRGAHPDGIVGRRVGGVEHNVGALADAKGDDVSGVGLDGDEVVGDDRERVPVDGELLDCLGAPVDHPEAVSLARREGKFGQPCIGMACEVCVGAVVVTFAIDEEVLGFWRQSRGQGAGPVQCLLHELKVSPSTVVPVGKHDRALVNVV